jgi:hypothetical protein
MGCMTQLSHLFKQRCGQASILSVTFKVCHEDSVSDLTLSWMCGVTSGLHVGGTFPTIQGLLSLSKCLVLHMIHGCLIAFYSLLHMSIMVVASTQSTWLILCHLDWELTG